MNLPRLSQDPRDPEFVQNPYDFYDTLRNAGQLVVWDDYAMPCAASYKVVDAILRDRRFGREAPACVAKPHPAHLKPFYDIEAHSMLELEPPRHTRLRSQVLRAFTARQVADMDTGIAALSHDLIDKFPDGPFDLISYFAEIIPVIVIARMMGVPDSMAKQLLSWSHDMVAMYQARRDRQVEDAAVAASIAFRAYILDLIAEKRANPQDDLISGLVNAGDGALTDDEIVTTCILLLNAGHEATVHAIGNGSAALLADGPINPDLYATPEATERTNAEILRYDPPLHMFTRYATSDIEVFGHTFAEGDEVALLLAAANRDPAKHDNPHVFDPTRKNAAHTSFGAGLHFCVGAPLARLELNVALPILFERCPNLALARAPVFADRYHFHGLTELMVTT